VSRASSCTIRTLLERPRDDGIQSSIVPGFPPTILSRVTISPCSDTLLLPALPKSLVRHVTGRVPMYRAKSGNPHNECHKQATRASLPHRLDCLTRQIYTKVFVCLA
jgi:hypothetical protein